MASNLLLGATEDIQINYSYDRVPTVREFTLSSARMPVIIGPFGSGKSSGAMWKIKKHAQEQWPNPKDGIRRTRWAIIRNTFRQLEDTTIRTVLEWWPPAIFGTFRSATHQYIINAFDECEIELLFRALDRPDHISNLLSLELSGAWVNEAREVPWAIIDALDGRIDRFPAVKDGGCTKPVLMLDSNPPEEESEMWKKCEEVKPANLELFKQPSGLSPKAENIMTMAEWEQYKKDFAAFGKSSITPGLKPDYYINLADGKQQDYIDVYIHAKYGFVKEGKAVYENTWNDALHMAKGRIQAIEGKELTIPFDFGLTPAGALMQVTPRGYVNILKELVSDGMGFEQFIANMLKPVLATEFSEWPVVFTGDPAGEQRSQNDEKTCYDILRQEFKNQISSGHYKIRTCPSNDLVPRIGSVEHFLSRLTDGRPTFQVDPSCKMIRKGFNKGYYYKRVKVSDERYSDEPFKNIYSHIMNAVEYGCLYMKEGAKRAERKRPPGRKYVVPSKGGY